LGLVVTLDTVSHETSFTSVLTPSGMQSEAFVNYALRVLNVGFLLTLALAVLPAGVAMFREWRRKPEAQTEVRAAPGPHGGRRVSYVAAQVPVDQVPDWGTSVRPTEGTEQQRVPEWGKAGKAGRQGM
jgi:hypothetical protein